MRRLFFHLIVALLTFSIGYALFTVAEIYNLKTEIREYEKRVEAEKVVDAAPVSQKPSAGEVVRGKLKARCQASQTIKDKARAAECAEYYQIIEELLNKKKFSTLPKFMPAEHRTSVSDATQTSPE
jgi:hypothetical protein